MASCPAYTASLAAAPAGVPNRANPRTQAFLIERIPEGFSFPLNPKWLLCDEGWWEVFQALQASEAAAPALDAWFPGGLREEMAAIRAAHPGGFQATGAGAEAEVRCHGE